MKQGRNPSGFVREAICTLSKTEDFCTEVRNSNSYLLNTFVFSPLHVIFYLILTCLHLIIAYFMSKKMED